MTGLFGWGCKLLREDTILARDYDPPRKDGRFLSTLGFKQHLLRSLKPRLAFDPGMNPERYQSWKQQVRGKLLDLMRFPEPPPQPPPKKLWAQPREGYRLEKWECYPETASVVPFLMLIPDGVSETAPAPAVLCFPGSTQPKEWLAGEDDPWEGYPQRPHRDVNDMARQYARAGMVAVAIDNPGTGELVEQPESLGPRGLGNGRIKLSQELICIGRHYVGLSAFQKKTILDWVKTVPFVRTDRIALSGHSLGTEPLMVLAVLDPDIAAVVSNDYAPSNDDVNTRITIALWHTIPDFWLWLDLSELLAAIAPTPLLLTEGGHWTVLDHIRKAFAKAGAPDNLTVHHYPRYAEAEARVTDGKPMPYGLTLEDYLTASNVDVPAHCFKGNVAVPWLKQVLGRDHAPQQNETPNR
jgi:dienelactone hydrolase